MPKKSVKQLLADVKEEKEGNEELPFFMQEVAPVIAELQTKAEAWSPPVLPTIDKEWYETTDEEEEELYRKILKAQRNHDGSK